MKQFVFRDTEMFSGADRLSVFRLTEVWTRLNPKQTLHLLSALIQVQSKSDRTAGSLDVVEVLSYPSLNTKT